MELDPYMICECGAQARLISGAFQGDIIERLVYKCFECKVEISESRVGATVTEAGN